MPLPVVAIVGRPNVGKSSVFNALLRSRIAIVDPTAGVTRDRVATTLRAGHRRCQLVDTGGIGIVDEAGLEAEIERQIQIAVDEADLLLFLVDCQAGLLPADSEIARRLRKLGKPILLVANKSDTPFLDSQALAFFSLGLGEPVTVAAETGRGVGELRDRIGKTLPEPEEESEEETIHLAVVGRTNAGKSTLINRLVGRERMIVSEVPGTTRDAVDLPFVAAGRSFVGVDTAGMRRRKAISGSPDFYGQARTERAIRRSHVVLLLIDATAPIGRIEQQIADVIVKAHRPVILCISKWDLVEGERTLAEYEEYLRDRLPFLSYAPITCLSSLQGFHVEQTMNLAGELFDQAGKRMGTAEILRLVKDTISRHGPPTRGGRTGKIFFAAQVDVHPPTIVLFVNDESALTDPYRRFLSAKLRAAGPFPEVPIRLLVRPREERNA